MYDFQKPLAEELKKARTKAGLTQEQVAELAGVDPMNITKMENVTRNANPELATLYPVIRALNVDPRSIFYPGLNNDSPYGSLLQQVVSDCTEEEAETLYAVVRELVHFMRSKGKEKIT